MSRLPNAWPLGRQLFILLVLFFAYDVQMGAAPLGSQIECGLRFGAP
jgi:hypothetical protein